MKKKIVAGNWKMNKTLSEAQSLFKAVNEQAASPNNLEHILIFPPMPYVHDFATKIRHQKLAIGTQNVASEKSGAFTGEVSVDMLLSVGAKYTLIGHSERRQYYHEDHTILKKKLNLCLEGGLLPVFCCGENLEEREAGKHFSVVEKQLTESLLHVDAGKMGDVIIAYEPVWAIGTGKTATADQANEMHAFIRQILAKKYNSQLADSTYILYGGSCNAANAKDLFSCPDIDGGLIGGASLKADEFLSIIAGLDD